MADNANTVFRDFNTDGVPGSGIKSPDKSDVREWGTWLERHTVGPTKDIAVTNYTLLPGPDGDIGYRLNFTASTAITVNVPAGLSAGFFCSIRQSGIGTVTIAGAAGVVIEQPDQAFSTEGRFVTLVLAQLSTLNKYQLEGRAI